MSREVISKNEKRKLAALSISKSFGGISQEEEEKLKELRKRKKLQEAIDKQNS